jgi:hypothetical protein
MVAVGGAPPAEMKEGEREGEVVVTRIEPSAVVFEHEGREVRIRVGSR